MFVVNIRGLWIFGLIVGISYWVACGGPIPAAWSSTLPDDDAPYVTLWEPLIQPNLPEYDGEEFVSDPEYIGERDLASEGGYDPDE